MNRFSRGAYQLHVVLGQHPTLRQSYGHVQRRLSAHRRQERIRSFAFDDAFHHFQGDRLDIGAIGQFGVGHDRRRIAVDQDNAIAFFPQRLARLRP